MRGIVQSRRTHSRHQVRQDCFVLGRLSNRLRTSAFGMSHFGENNLCRQTASRLCSSTKITHHKATQQNLQESKHHPLRKDCHHYEPCSRLFALSNDASHRRLGPSHLACILRPIYVPPARPTHRSHTSSTDSCQQQIYQANLSQLP